MTQPTDEDLRAEESPEERLDPRQRDPEAPEADAAEQATPAAPADAAHDQPEIKSDVSEYDAIEQTRVVAYDDEYR